MSYYPPMPPLNEPRIEYYPVIYKPGYPLIHGLMYEKNNQEILANPGDKLFILINNELQPLGKKENITIGNNNNIVTYKLGDTLGRYKFTDKYPQYSTTPINELDLYVGNSKTTGGRNRRNGRKSRKGKSRKGGKSRKITRK